MHVLSPSKSADCRAGNEISVPGSGFCSFRDGGWGWLAGWWILLFDLIITMIPLFVSLCKENYEGCGG